MSKSVKNTIILLSVVVVMALLGVLLFFINKPYVNPDSLTGNTSSNLNNGGKFCEYNDMVYFANSNDNDSLYVMNSDESKAKKLNNVSVVSINTDGHRIFYSQSAKSSGTGLGYISKIAGLYSCNLNGNDVQCFTTNPVDSVLLWGNQLLYQHYVKNQGSTEYVSSLDYKARDGHMVLNQYTHMTSVNNNYLYYGNMDGDHYLYTYDPVTEQSEIFWEHNVYNPVYHNDGWIYFMDPDTEYQLHRYNPGTGEEQALCEERIDSFNVYDSFVYYQSCGDVPALHRISTDGNGDTVIIEGVYNNIQITSQYAYFSPFNNDVTTYHVSHYSSSAELFTP